MTTGERAVYAAEFVRALAEGMTGHDAAVSASSAVWMLQELGQQPFEQHAGAAALNAHVADMLKPEVG